MAAETTERRTAGKAPRAAHSDAWRRVKIKLFKDNGKYKEPLYVSVNDYTAVIKRGVEVEVPYFVARHIEEMQEADAKTAALIESLSEEYDRNMKKNF